MANPSLILWCDPTTNKLYSGWNQNIQPPTPFLKQGDLVGVELHWVNRGAYTSMMKEIKFPESATISLAIGKMDTAPSSGTFTLTYNSEETDDLAFDISATNLEEALNALSTISSEGGVTVEKSSLIYKITWNEKVVSTHELSCDATCLYPTSQAMISQAKEGSSTSRRIMMFSVKQSALAATNTFTASSAPVISVENVLPKTWRISISPIPKDGVFVITYTNGSTNYSTEPIPVSASPSDIARFLKLVQNLSFTVTLTGDYTWDISCPSVITNITTSSALVGFSSMYGLLDLNTVEMEEFLSGKQFDTAFLEVQVDIDGELQTLIQTGVVLMNDLIDQTSFNVVSRGSVMPIESVVRYDTSQALTSPQKTQARTNIDALGLGDLSVVESDITALGGRVTQIESYSVPYVPTDDEKDAMSGSSSPSSSNVFITNSVLTSGLNTRAATVHTHVSSDITDATAQGISLLTATNALQQRNFLGLGTMATQSSSSYAALSGAIFTGPVTIPTGSTVYDYLPLSGGTMTGQLNTNDIVISSGYSLFVSTGGIQFADATSQDTRVVREAQTNTFSGNFSAIEYPNEVKIVDNNGDSYWVPARPV